MVFSEKHFKCGLNKSAFMQLSESRVEPRPFQKEIWHLASGKNSCFRILQ